MTGHSLAPDPFIRIFPRWGWGALKTTDARRGPHAQWHTGRMVVQTGCLARVCRGAGLRPGSRQASFR